MPKEFTRRAFREADKLFKLMDKVKAGEVEPLVEQNQPEPPVTEVHNYPLYDRSIPPSEYLGLLPHSPKSNWEYAMNLDIDQVGQPSAWGERTDLMEIYRRYRHDDKQEEDSA